MCSCSGGSSVDAANQSISSPLTPDLGGYEDKPASCHAYNRNMHSCAQSWSSDQHQLTAATEQPLVSTARLESDCTSSGLHVEQCDG
jgi:hypothetical protein